LAYDEFSRSVITKKPTPWQRVLGSAWTDVDDTQFANWLQHSYLIANSRQIPEAVEVAARDNTFHPVRDYLNRLKWDGERRIDHWLVRHMGSEEKPINRAFGSKWLISAVARVFKPGSQVDHTLLLEGTQGIKKSTALRMLASDEWFTDHISDLRDKDARIELQGKWIIEFSELHAIKGKSFEIVKSFLSTRVDHFRAPWGRRSTANPRQCVFAATTNDETSLADETGNRRFWPVRCRNIDIEGLKRDRDQLWAEACVRFQQGEAWWLDSDELVEAAREEQKARYQPGPWDEQILVWAENPQPFFCPPDSIIEDQNEEPLVSRPGCVTIAEILRHGLGIKPKEVKRGDDRRVMCCLKANGWRSDQMRSGPLRDKRFWHKVGTDLEQILSR
jgi:putative DNA primase/helicase